MAAVGRGWRWSSPPPPPSPTPTYLRAQRSKQGCRSEYRAMTVLAFQNVALPISRTRRVVSRGAFAKAT